MTAAPAEKRSGGKSLFVMVGDISADKHTAKIIAKLKNESPDLHIWGVGGPEMAKQNFEILHNCKDFPLGILEVAKHLHFLTNLRKEVTALISQRKPDAVLLVDFGGFNLPLGRDVRKLFPELPITYFISPQIWGSRPWRINTIEKFATKMLVIFPFEEPLYKSHGINARFIGHPLSVTLPQPETLGTREQFCHSVGLDPAQHIIGIFPGSRKGEIKTHIPIVLKAVKELRAHRNDVQFVFSAADAEKRERIAAQIAKAGTQAKVISHDQNYGLMRHADVLWAKSGTTALEATMYATPMLIFYAGDWFSFLAFLAFKQVKWVGMPNLLSGESLVPELIKLDCRAELLVRYTDDLLDVPGLRQEISEKLAGLRNKLGEGEYTSNCASEILNVI